MRSLQSQDQLGPVFGAPASGRGYALICVSAIRHARDKSGCRMTLSRCLTHMRCDQQSVCSPLVRICDLHSADAFTDDHSEASIDEGSPVFVSGLINSRVCVLTCPTQWKRAPHRRVSYQIGARIRRYLRIPTRTEVDALLGCADGYDTVPLGKHMTVRENVGALTKNDLFTRIDPRVATDGLHRRHSNVSAHNHAAVWGKNTIIRGDAQQLILEIIASLEQK